jgi:hypothetical protein
MKVRDCGDRFESIKPLVNRVTKKLSSIVKPSFTAQGPSRSRTSRPAQRGDLQRERTVQIFAKALSAHIGEDTIDLIELSSEIEAEMFASFDEKRYKTRIKDIRYNLSDPKNSDLRSRLFSGALSP